MSAPVGIGAKILAGTDISWPPRRLYFDLHIGCNGWKNSLDPFPYVMPGLLSLEYPRYILSNDADLLYSFG